MPGRAGMPYMLNMLPKGAPDVSLLITLNVSFASGMAEAKLPRASTVAELSAGVPDAWKTPLSAPLY